MPPRSEPPVRAVCGRPVRRPRGCDRFDGAAQLRQRFVGYVLQLGHRTSIPAAQPLADVVANASRILLASASTTASSTPTSRTVSSMPGMDVAPLLRTERTNGAAGSERGAGASLQHLQPAEHVATCARPWRRAGLHIRHTIRT